MHLENLRCIEEKLAECAKVQLEKGIEQLDVQEYGAVTDMIKDIAEAEYYATITVAMEEAKKEDEMLMMMGMDDGRRYYNSWRHSDGRFARKGTGEYRPPSYYRRGYDEPPYYRMTPEMYRDHEPEYYRDMDRSMGRMYYTDNGNSGNGGRNNSGGNYSGSNRNYSDGNNGGMRDGREGRSGSSRRTYMESKEMYKDNSAESKQHKMKELEKYMNELASDITDMISDASNEEKTLLKQKMQVLTQKI